MRRYILTILLSVLFLLCSCTESGLDEDTQLTLTRDEAAEIILLDQFWSRLYAGDYYILPNTSWDTYYEPLIRYSEIPQEQLDVCGIDFGKLISDKYSDYMYASMPFSSLGDLHTAMEQTYTVSYAQKAFYDVYDFYYKEEDGKLLFWDVVSPIFLYLDFDSIAVEDYSAYVNFGMYGESTAVYEFERLEDNTLRISDFYYIS